MRVRCDEGEGGGGEDVRVSVRDEQVRVSVKGVRR